jgi:hypothetical protein
LDFLVLFSSETAFTGGGLGQVDYCAANAFLDGYARHHVGSRRLVTSINWGEWQWNAWEEGMGGFSAEVQEYFRANRRKYGIAFEEGQEALARILTHRLPRVAVSTRDFGSIVEESNKHSAMQIILDAANRSQETQAPGDGIGQPTLRPRPALMTPFVAPSNETEQYVTEIWQNLLGIDGIGAQDNFLELGGNSLIGIQLVSCLRKDYQVDVNLRIVFESPTVAQMAMAIEEALIAEMENLTDEEVSRLLESDKESGIRLDAAE